jgi:hypothetical protein
MLVAVALSQQIQVRLVEEPYRLRAHGDAYREYTARTGPFLPGIGRLRAADDGQRPRPPGQAAARPQPDRNQDGSAPSPTRPCVGT